MNKRLITLTVNGDTHEVAVSPTQTLNQVIRDDLRLTGTKRGCTSGSCGVCTVNGDRGEAVLSCLALAVEWDGRAITTIEGVEREGRLDVLQQAFWDTGAVQCGFCTPGLVMSARALLNENPAADAAAINDALAGAICRCTGHIKVKEAVARAVATLAAGQGGADGPQG
jgi:aerobic-type carbon monoxide dehydrogenase small subunit (CoxS/CutS family)